MFSAIDVDHPRKPLLFSNAILEGFLNFTLHYSKKNNKNFYKELVESVGVPESELRDPGAWRSAGYIHHFFQKYRSFFPEKEEIVRQGSRFLFTQNRFQLFTSLGGLLLRPELVFGKLPKASKRMNHYNTFEFKVREKTLSTTQATLRVGYADPELTELNECLCEASRGSVEGILEFLGYRLIHLEEGQCVRKGDDHCELWMIWVNRVRIRELLLPLSAVFGAWYLLQYAHETDITSGVGALVMGMMVFLLQKNYFQKRRMTEAFEFQQKTLEDLRSSYLKQEELSQGLIELQASGHEMLRLARLGEISHSYVHDLASPMNVVQYCSDWISSSLKGGTYSSEDMVKNTSRIQKAVKTMQKMNVLWRKMGVQGGDRKFIEQNPCEVVKDTMDLFENILAKHSIQFEGGCGLDIPTSVMILENSIEQVVINLVQNAIAALNQVNDRPTKLSVTLMTATHQPDHLVLKIEDNGPGIPPARQEKLFQLFGESTSKHGTGFGMYAVNQVVLEMQGKIELESQPGRTCWKISFPLKPNLGARSDV